MSFLENIIHLDDRIAQDPFLARNSEVLVAELCLSEFLIFYYLAADRHENEY